MGLVIHICTRTTKDKFLLELETERYWVRVLTIQYCKQVVMTSLFVESFCP